MFKLTNIKLDRRFVIGNVLFGIDGATSTQMAANLNKRYIRESVVNASDHVVDLQRRFGALMLRMFYSENVVNWREYININRIQSVQQNTFKHFMRWHSNMKKMPIVEPTLSKDWCTIEINTHRLTDIYACFLWIHSNDRIIGCCKTPVLCNNSFVHKRK